MPKMWQCESVRPGTTVSPCKIDLLERVNFFRVFIRADEDDAFIPNRNGFGVRLPLVHRVDISVYENEVDIVGCCAIARRREASAKTDRATAIDKNIALSH